MPNIQFSEYFKGTYPDFADTYFCEVTLLNSNMDVIDSFSNDATCAEEWANSGHIFQSYGSGLRYIRIEHGGVDTEFFNGNYGSVTDATMIALTPSTSGLNDKLAATSFFRVSPNPSAGRVLIRSENAPQSNVTVSAIDLTGKVVFRKKEQINNAQMAIDFSSLKSSLYFILCRSRVKKSMRI